MSITSEKDPRADASTNQPSTKNPQFEEEVERKLIRERSKSFLDSNGPKTCPSLLKHQEIGWYARSTRHSLRTKNNHRLCI